MPSFKTHPGDVLIEKPENDDPSKVDWARYWLEQRQKEEADIAKKKAEEEANKKAEEAAKKAEEAKKSPSFSGDDAINDFDNINMTQNTLGDLSNINSFMDKANLPESFKNAVDHSINSTKSDFTQAKNLVEEKKDYYDGKFKEIKEKIEKEEHPISGESDEIDNAKAEMPQNNQIVEDAPQDIDVINNDEPMRQEEAEDPQNSSIDFPISEPSPYIPETPSPFDETPNDDSGFLDI